IIGYYENNGLKLKIFKNSDGLTLSSVEEFPGIYYGNLNWGDYDNDGDLDLVVSGNSTISGDVGTDPITRVYRYTGSGSFMEDDSLFLLGAGTSTVLWGDYDADGDLDLLVAGTSVSEDDFSLIYDNLESINNENLPPYTPSGFTEIVDTSTVILNWVDSEDRINPNGGSTPSSAITYNLQLGYNDGSHEIVSGNVSYGFGALGSLEKEILKNLKDGTYYWRVQALDNGFARSEWSPVQSFYIDTTHPEVDSVTANFGPAGSEGQIILVIRFVEEFGMDNSVNPQITVLHPEGALLDTIWAEEQSYSGNVWTGVVNLPEDYPGRAIKIMIKRAKDLRGNEMIPVTIFRTPSKVISSIGGTIISEDGRVTLQLSPNAVTEDVVIRIHPVESFILASVDTTASLIESVYKITPEFLVLEKPTILSILYDTSSSPTALLGFNPNSLFIGRINTDSSLTWIGGTIDTTRGSRRISASIDTLGHYAVFKNIGFPVGEFRRLGNLTCQPRIFSPRGGTFATKTSIIFDMQESEKVTVRIFNPAGRLKRTLFEGQIMNPGKNTVSWDGRDDRKKIVVSGLYIVTVETAKTSKATTVGVLNK
ncbi:MAG: VCBS repeat-containing protein, partial [Candidatus Marinimicrobia bacterium]|nr:VCBS repeat-containing protein [Candidatus Neomarinimicrobiota bacterium]